MNTIAEQWGAFEVAVIPLAANSIERTCEQGCNGCDECTDYEDDDPWNQPAAMCEHCSGTGGDPWNDGITPCEYCDGEGYEWWK